MLAVALLTCALSSTAWAQSADQLYDQGMQELNAGRYTEAAKALDASYRKKQLPKTLYGLGLAYKGMGYPSKALQAFESYVQFADPKVEKDTIRAVKGEIERLKTNYARFALKLAPADATLEIDGKPAQAVDGELWVTKGKHKITARAKDYETYEQTLDVGAGRFDLEIQLRKPNQPPDERAAALVDAGVALAAAGNTDEAIGKFKEAQEIHATSRGAGELGLAQMTAGDYGDAERNVNEALATPRDPWVRENRKKLKAAQRKMRRDLATLQVSGTPDGAEISVNGRAVGALPLERDVRVMNGNVTVRAEKQGYEDFEEMLPIKARARRAVVVSMKEGTKPAAAAVPVAVGAGAAGAGAAAASGALTGEEAPPDAAQEPPPPAPISTDVETQEAARPEDIEAFTDPHKDLAGEEEYDTKSATGFEMAVNFGYQFWIGGDKFQNSKGALTPQVLLGARPIWPISFGLQLNAGWDLDPQSDTEATINAFPGIYVRGHIQQEKKPLAFDAWAGTGLSPFAMQIGALKAGEVDMNAIDPNQIDDADIVRATTGIKGTRTLQSVNIPIELGATFYITEGFGIDLATSLTFWLPTQECLHDGEDRICSDSNRKSQTSLYIGGGLSFLP